MLSKNELKYIQSLCQKKQRQLEGLFIAEGTKLAAEIFNSSYVISKVYVLSEWAAHVPKQYDTTIISAEELAKISQLQTPNQVLVIAEQPVAEKEPDLQNGITLLLDGIQDPGNLGTIIRIADWFGIKQVIAGEATADLYNPKVIQSTMGSFLRVQVWYRSLKEILFAANVPVYGALLDGKNINEVPPVSKGLLVIGNESKGISAELLPYINYPVTIPRTGGAESLNAAVATGIILARFVIQ